MVRTCACDELSRAAQQENAPPGCSKRPSSKAAASEGPEAYPLGYVEGLNDARTKLADFLSILGERSPVVPHIRTIEVLVCQHSFSAAY